MYKEFYILSILITLAIAGPLMDTDVMDNDDVHHSQHVVTAPPVVEILESGASHQADGSYHFHFRAEDGSFREETAVMKNPGTKTAYLEVNGAYSYFDVNGKEVVVEYTANHRGFVPHGGNIPSSIAEAAKRNSELPPLVEKRSESDATVIVQQPVEFNVVPTVETVHENS